MGGGLTVAKAGAFGGGLTVAETGAFGGGLSVGGAAIFQGPVTFQGGVNIAGQPGPIPNTAWSDGAANWLFINGDEQGAASDYDWISIEANEGVMISPGDSGLVVQGGSSFAGNVAVEGNARVDTLWVTGPDLLFGPLADRGAGGRALVHTGNNSLTANYAGDFGGGLIVEGPGLTVNGTARVGGLVQTGPDLRISFAPNGDGGRALSHTGGDTLLINQGQDFSGGTRVDGPLTTGIITLTDSDLRISAARNGAGGRALTHDGGNNLVINYNGDFARTFVQGSGLDVSGQLTTGTLTTGTLTTGGLHLTGADLVIAAAGRGDGGRALVHDNNDKLIINYANDFGGGTEMGGRLTVWGELNLRHDTVRINTARAIHRNPGNNWLEIDSDRSYAGTWVNSHVFSVASNISANGFNRSGCVRIDSGTNGGDLWCPEGFYVAGAQNNNNDAQQIDMIWCCRPR
ncbi:MAG: hypothetical protein FJ125_02700 [Deltaproteobacteria bacterium]|nr:hypothetical protein [Deltaproteobacteria bacterium]